MKGVALRKPPIPSAERIAGIVRALLAKRAIAQAVGLDDDLREIGISSIDLVNLMLSVESEFDLAIPDAEMTSVNFRSIASIDALVRTLSGRA